MWWPHREVERPRELPTIDVVIPVLNEEESLPLVLDAIPGAWVRRVVVVDNGSNDRSAERARERGAEVVEEPQRGYGAACLRGLRYMAEDPPEIVVFLDGDFSDFPAELPRVVEPILTGEAELVIGSRTLGAQEQGALLVQAVVGNKLACVLMELMYGYRFSDLGPFRAITWEALQALRMRDEDFGWTVEMQIKAARQGIGAVEVPVSYRKRIGVSKVTGTLKGSVLASYKILYTLFAQYALEVSAVERRRKR
ncbi:glycosyltransferase family 2 protein [Lujinxingia vulgaris]|uniref:Glycosyltransferase family 2 protein n=1 Tax=Lujinxingia vulgaris TaxID=2600176 RepID=A0A5C6X7H9_9DELT|nr:glycosyltransferase family 2 protein [Lujinxingia vulgaris]TXD37794.1 glycosyltransferase family 2 protein [Lujinxingia vulgaris]